MHPAIKKFREALQRVENKHNKSLIEHAIELAYDPKYTEVLLGILRKYLPDLSVTDMGATTLRDIMEVLNRDSKEEDK